MSLVACTLLFAACGKKERTPEQEAERSKRIMEMLLKEEGASDEEMAQVRCIMDLNKTVAPLKGKLTREHKIALRDQLELIEESPEECLKTIEMLNKFEQEIKTKESEKEPEKEQIKGVRVH